MPAYKNKENNSWYVVTQYTDWTGERKQKCKRGFSTRREALEWEQKFQQQSAGDLDMTFEAFVEIYTTDLKARLKESTWQTKEHIIRTKILPYFGKRKINEITTKDVIAWQNELLAYRDEKRKKNSDCQCNIFQPFPGWIKYASMPQHRHDKASDLKEGEKNCNCIVGSKSNQ